jgi:predicted aconitase with swiveling domain
MKVDQARYFQGKSILLGEVEGEALVTHQGFNTYASFFTSLVTHEEVARCSDRNNPQTHGKVLTDKVLCLPKTIGSTSSGAVWQRVAHLGMAPKALLFSGKIDSLAAGGLIVAEVWAGERIVTVDQLGDNFLEIVKDGDWVVINEDGIVAIRSTYGESYEIS